MLKIYFVRHGETEWNTQGIFQGRNNSNLTSEGKEQTLKLASKLKDKEFKAFYSSPLGRAMDTAQIIKGDRNIPIIPIDEFQEIGMGDVEGIPRIKFELTYPEEYFNFWNDAINYNPKAFGGESYAQVLERAELGLKKLIANHKDGNILVVTHGVMLKAICNLVSNHDISNFSKQQVPENTSVTIIDYIDSNFEISLFSNTDHLK
ncbi:histidine phosphatase family protein [Cetobacterium sp. 2A]|uniref:histidine phosphatase family protein n=1 Tax=Cetobacterium sp. 2A TaxID=2754723 RepID=UPI00163B7609|nr:histidine phosphatase family protein [Cetobacterium sp. 2A]MBC2856545.1 histidine phosphatase family protein [Cetobacterium sp. 2A]